MCLASWPLHHFINKFHNNGSLTPHWVESTNYCFGAIGVKIQFLYNENRRVRRHMKDLDQRISISKGYLISDILSWSNLKLLFWGYTASRLLLVTDQN